MSSTELTTTIGSIIEHFGSQMATAKAAGVSQPAISGWASGSSKPGLRSLMRIEKATKGKFKARIVRPELF